MEITGELLDLVLYGRQERKMIQKYFPWEGMVTYIFF